MKTVVFIQAKPNPFSGNRRNFFAVQQANNSFFSNKVVHPRHLEGVQAKLSFGQPGDKYEVEADAMADQVIQGLQSEQTPDFPFFNTTNTMTAVQPKSTECPEEEVQKKEEEVKEEEMVQTKSFVSDAGGSEEDVQLKCKTMEADIQAKGGETNPGPEIEAQLSCSRGRGSLLPKDTKESLEASMGADFSHVNIHTGSKAVQMSEQLSAQAFTHGKDIYFNQDKYNPNSTAGRHLLAHELTHTIQQNSINIQRVEGGESDQPPSSNERYAADSIIDLIEGFEVTVKSSDDIEEKAFAARTLIVLNKELNNITTDEGDSEEAVIDSKENMMDYGTQLITELDDTLTSEEKTFLYLTGNSPEFENLIDSEYYLQNLNAFPKLTLGLVLPLIKIPADAVGLGQRDSKSELPKLRIELSNYFFEKGFPLSYEASLSLSNYKHIKTLPPRNYYTNSRNRPEGSSDFDFLIAPDTSNQLIEVFGAYYSQWTQDAIISYMLGVYKEWAKMISLARSRIVKGELQQVNIEELIKFKADYPEGFQTVEQFLEFEGTSKEALNFNILNLSTFFNFTKFLANFSAAKRINEFLKNENSSFNFCKGQASAQIALSSPEQKLTKAIRWYLNKGFAKRSIEAFVNDIDQLLINILRERAEESFVKRFVSTLASLHPVGRLVALGYQVYKTVEDAKETLDIVEKIFLIKEAISNAKESISVENTQKAAANLAMVSTSLLPDLMGKLIEIGTKKIAKNISDIKDSKSGTKTNHLEDYDKSKSTTDHRKNLAASEDMDWATLKKHPYLLKAEFDAIKETKPDLPSELDSKKYSIVVKLPNKHQWKKRRSDGGWCRFSKGDCLNNNDLDEFADDFNDLEMELLRRNNEGLLAVNEPGSIFDDPRLHQTSKGNFGEAASDKMMASKGYETLIGITRPENSDRGPGIDNIWIPSDTTHFDYTISETKYITDFDYKSMRSIRLGMTKSGKQGSDSWIAGKNFNTGGYRLEDAVGREDASRIREALRANRVERLIVVVDQTGKTWVFEADSEGLPYRLKK